MHNRWHPGLEPLAEVDVDEEVRLETEDGLAGQLTRVFENDREKSERIDESRWSRRSPHHRLAETGARLLRREL